MRRAPRCGSSSTNPLGAGRHDHRVLDLLGFDEAEHFGAEIRGPVRPADAAARDRRETQVHAFDARRVDPDLAEGRVARRLTALLSSLKASVAAGPPVRRRLVEVRARWRRSVQDLAQDAVLVEARTPASAPRCAARIGCSRCLPARRAILRAGSKRRWNSFQEIAREAGMARSVSASSAGRTGAELAQIGGVGRSALIPPVGVGATTGG
jgi:hypothetical protein